MSIVSIDWKLIGTCNLQCLHCYGPPKNEKSLPYEDLLRIIENFTALGIQTVVLTGGEPLLVPRIGEIMQKLHKAGVRIALSTNASYFSRYISEITKYVYSLNLALDGSTPEIHAKSRANQQTFHDCLDALRYYQQHTDQKPPLLRIGTVYSRVTAGDFLNISALLESFACIIDTWKIYELIDHELQPELRRPILHDHAHFQKEMQYLLKESKLATKLMIAPCSARDKAYFMVNPRGQVVVPTDSNGITHDVLVGNFLRDNLNELVKRWEGMVHLDNYRWNHQHYLKPGSETT